ncbi:hypothetical protein GF312_15495 [Candidatus Poribacteria bacterium]|nr:hypothetical protein [Candidatus Poribacteria bacterium]
MKCEKIKSLLSAYIDGETSVKDSRIIKKHISRCYECSEELRLMQEVSDFLGNWKDVQTSDDFCEVLLAKAENISLQPHRRITNAVRPFAGPGGLFRFAFYGAAILLFFAGLIVLSKFTLSESPMVEPLPNRISIQKIDQDKTNISSPDSSLHYMTMAEMKTAGIWE